MLANAELVNEFYDAIEKGILKRWYPLVIDKECGGYLTNFSFNWAPHSQQEKMIVSQARHIWSLSRCSEFFGGIPDYITMAYHGFKFLCNSMWDATYGGFFQIRSQQGGLTDVRKWFDEKRTYGNAFALFALAALYGQTQDDEVMEWAMRTFYWIEEHAYDTVYGGYFQFLTPEGKPFDQNSEYKTQADDKAEVGLKDQNSSIHLLEAYTELYKQWKDPFLKQQLHSLLELIRDTMVTQQGFLKLFFRPTWEPISFSSATKEEHWQYYALDHVSFGHDYETAFLLLEASYVLELQSDTQTLITAKKMMDHAIMYGWDPVCGGFFDGGCYLKGKEHCDIIKHTKTWWAQAEGLNALLLFAYIFPEEEQYRYYFLKLWEYIKLYVLDYEYGDWFEGGVDKEPYHRYSPKSHMWKCTYHTLRALMNCISLLKNDESKRITRVAHFWKECAKHYEIA